MLGITQSEERHRSVENYMSNECQCGAAEWIALGKPPTTKFYSRHRIQMDGLPKKKCEPAIALSNARRAELKDNSPPIKRKSFSDDLPLDALCGGCGITPEDTIGTKWKGRHKVHKTVPCVDSKNAYNAAVRRPGNVAVPRDAEGNLIRKNSRAPKKQHDTGIQHDTLTLEEYHRIRSVA